ncbi:MAG: hydrogenase maturation nickel metallochaperone HypA [Kiritimatiellales bacterium]|nr:hydrogenase maturation nickel metallochaperone HypA [Pontiella sp.]NNJ70225.1 hydrogenase maturation nickel metallochaperone HypA [Kiritimatiellales bacterium]
MHELSLAQGLVEQLRQTAEAEGATRVTSVTVVIGNYSGVEPDAFEFAFPFATEGTLVDGAELIIDLLPVSVECRQCKTTSHPEPINLVCMKCGSDDVVLQGGREFLIRSVEIDVP